MKTSEILFLCLIFLLINFSNGCMRTPNVSETADIPLTTTNPTGMNPGTGGPDNPADPPVADPIPCMACATLPTAENSGAGAPDISMTCSQSNVRTVTCMAPSEVQYKTTMAGVYQTSGTDTIDIMCNAATGKYVFMATEVNFLTC